MKNIGKTYKSNELKTYDFLCAGCFSFVHFDD